MIKNIYYDKKRTYSPLFPPVMKSKSETAMAKTTTMTTHPNKNNQIRQIKLTESSRQRMEPTMARRALIIVS